MDEELVKEIGPTVENYHASSGVYVDIPIVMRWEQYYWMEKEGVYRMFTAREDGALLGYAGYFLTYPPTGYEILTAGHDSLYVAPEHRGRGLAKGLIEYSEEILGADGVGIVQHNVSVRLDYAPLLEAMDYTLTDRIYSRRLHNDGNSDSSSGSNSGSRSEPPAESKGGKEV